MALTLQSGIDLARVDLNDTDASAYRTDDPTMLKHANAALLELFNRAPHLWHGQYASVPSGEQVAAFSWPIHQQYLKAFADIIVAYAESKDDEYVVNEKVSAIMSRSLGVVVA